MNIAHVITSALIILLSGYSTIALSAEKKTMTIPKVEEISDITVSADVYNKSLTIEEFKKILGAAKIIAASDPLLKDWHYTLPAMGTFRTKNNVYKFELYLGGLGNIVDPGGKKTWFLSQHKD